MIFSRSLIIFRCQTLIQGNRKDVTIRVNHLNDLKINSNGLSIQQRSKEIRVPNLLITERGHCNKLSLITMRSCVVERVLRHMLCCNAD